MGIYQYTLRADTKVVGGLEIAHYEFAYKHTSWPDGQQRRREASASHHAENAQYKLRHVHHWVQGKWSYADDKDGLTVFASPELRSEFTEEWRHCPIVGILRRDGKRYRVDPPSDWMLAHNERLAEKAA